MDIQQIVTDLRSERKRLDIAISILGNERWSTTDGPKRGRPAKQTAVGSGGGQMYSPMKPHWTQTPQGRERMRQTAFKRFGHKKKGK